MLSDTCGWGAVEVQEEMSVSDGGKGCCQSRPGREGQRYLSRECEWLEHRAVRPAHAFGLQQRQSEGSEGVGGRNTVSSVLRR